MSILRGYQTKVIDDIRQAIKSGARRILLVAPTGSGKTVIATDIIRSSVEKSSPSLFFAHRRELVHQCAAKIRQFGISPEMIMSGVPLNGGFSYCNIASVDTFRARCMKSNKIRPPRIKLLFIDEAHRSLSPTYLKIITELYPNVVLIGLTATPIRADGKGMGHVYDAMVKCPSIKELTDMGYLVPAVTFAPTIPDLTGVNIRLGDYNSAELETRMNNRKLVGDVVTHWHRLASDRKTVVFASGVKHSIHLRDEFVKSGVRAAHIDGTTPTKEREEILYDLKHNKLQLVTNCGVLIEGWDEPSLSACVDAAPTRHLGKFLQKNGRVLRPFHNKEETFLIDHSGNFYEHGFVHDEHDWTLTEGRALESDNKERQKKLDEREPITCVQCTRAYTGQLICPYCGHEPVKKGQYVESLSGDLMEVRAEKRKPKKREFTVDDKQKWYQMFLSYGRGKQYNNPSGWAAHKFKEKFKEWPNRDFAKISVEPTAEVLSYIRSRNIASAYRRKKQNANINQASR